MNTQTTAIIRQRGQLTIPDSVRAQFSWIRTDSVVTIKVQHPDTIVITPLQQADSDTPDWDMIWKMIKRARAVPGKGKMSASEFIAKDRNLH